MPGKAKRRPPAEASAQDELDDLIYEVGDAFARGAFGFFRRKVAEIKAQAASVGEPPPWAPPPSDSTGDRARDQGRPTEPKPKADPYAILGVVRGLPLDVYEAAFKAQARHYHPDKGGGDPERMKAINVAIKAIRTELKLAKA